MANIDAQLFVAFKAAAENVGAKVYRAEQAEEARAIILNILKENAVQEVVSVESPIATQLGLKAAITEAGYQLSYHNLKEKSLSAQVGISDADYAVAEIGSLCMKDCTDIKQRLVSTLPTAHIALVKANNLVPNLITCMQRIQAEYGAEVPGYISFITGPSRTADIERVLTIGVHGPKQLFIVIVD